MSNQNPTRLTLRNATAGPGQLGPVGYRIYDGDRMVGLVERVRKHWVGRTRDRDFVGGTRKDVLVQMAEARKL